MVGVWLVLIGLVELFVGLLVGWFVLLLVLGLVVVCLGCLGTGIMLLGCMFAVVCDFCGGCVCRRCAVAPGLG